MMAATKLRGTAAYPVRWNFPSMTDPDKEYVVSQKPDGVWGCSCPRWIFNKERPRTDCKHIEAVKANEPIDMTRTSAKAAEAYLAARAALAHARTTNKQATVKIVTDEPVFLLHTGRKIILPD